MNPFISFLSQFSSCDKTLTESLEKAYKIIFEYQTDLFLTDEESIEVDKKDKAKYAFNNTIRDFLDNYDEVTANTLADYLDNEVVDNAVGFTKYMLSDNNIDFSEIELLDGDIILKVDDSAYFLFTGESFTRYYDASDMKSEIAESPNSFIPVSAKRLYDIDDEFNTDFWETPNVLYHATDPENVEDILEDGLEARNQTRGLSNRSVSGAVFTVDNIEIDISSYGDSVIKIDTPSMKRDGYMPYVSQEPDVSNYQVIESLYHLYGIDDSPDNIESGVYPETIIVHGNIPPKYLTVID